MKLTRAITHIPIQLDIKLDAANQGKLMQLNLLASAYLELCQTYTTAFCTTVEPDPYADAWIDTPLSARWQRVAIQHAAGIAQSWRINRDRTYRAYQERSVWHAQQEKPRYPAPIWTEWKTPVLNQAVLQANANVVALLPPKDQPAEEPSVEQRSEKVIVLEPAKGTTFDYWLRISTTSGWGDMSGRRLTGRSTSSTPTIRAIRSPTRT